MQFKSLEKLEHFKSQISKQYKIVIIRAEINKIETKKYIEIIKQKVDTLTI